MSLEDLGSRFEVIRARQTAISHSQTSLNKDAADLFPAVLAHFNGFLNQTLNPAMSSGYSIRDSTVADYYPSGFQIQMGPINVPEGCDSERVWPGRSVVDLLDNYIADTPWVFDVKTTFYYPK